MASSLSCLTTDALPRKLTLPIATSFAALLGLSTGTLANPAPTPEVPPTLRVVTLLSQLGTARLPDGPFWSDEREEDGEEPDGEGEDHEGEQDPILSVPTLMAPTLDKSIAYRERAERAGLARPELETATIRRGLGTVGSGPYAATERAVGFRIGPQLLSLETALVSGNGTWQGSDTRLDWSLARRSTTDGNGVLWSLSTGGGFGMAGSGSQNANAMLGYRYSLFETVTLTSEIALASSYAFASGAMPEAKLTPQLQIVTDLGLAPATPWKTMLDVKMNREMPLSGRDYRSSASAMLRLQLGAN